MWLAEYLMRPVIPLSERIPEQKGRTGRPKGNPETNALRRATALAKYKAACTQEWTPTNLLVANLGGNHGSCHETLRKWMKQGIIERRKVGSPETWRRSDGFEWKFVENEK